MLPDTADGTLHLVHLPVGNVLRVGRVGQCVDVVAQLRASASDLGTQHLRIVLAHRFSSSWPFRAFGTLLNVSVVFGRPWTRFNSALPTENKINATTAHTAATTNADHSLPMYCPKPHHALTDTNTSSSRAAT